MTEPLYVVTADTTIREEDGRDYQDGSVVYRSHTVRETWSYPATATVGDIMSAVRDVGGFNVQINVDRVTAEKIREERSETQKIRWSEDN